MNIILKFAKIADFVKKMKCNINNSMNDMY